MSDYMQTPIWIYKGLIFGVVGIGMLIKFIIDLPKINYLFAFGGIGFSFVFITASYKLSKDLEEHK